MIHFDDVTKENIEYYPNWPQISDHLYRILIVGARGLDEEIQFLI